MLFAVMKQDALVLFSLRMRIIHLLSYGVRSIILSGLAVEHSSETKFLHRCFCGSILVAPPTIKTIILLITRSPAHFEHGQNHIEK